MCVTCLTFNALLSNSATEVVTEGSERANAVQCILCFQPLITAQAEIFPCYVKLCVRAQRPVQWWTIYTSVCLLSGGEDDGGSDFDEYCRLN